MNCKGSAKGMKHKINSILFSNLLRFTFSCLILTRILHLSIFLAFFIKKIDRSFGSSRKSANFALAIQK